VPTGVALRDAREQLIDAAERVLVREGPRALTSRAVTTEAGVAKGLAPTLPDFDALLLELVLDRCPRVNERSAVLVAAAGTRTVADNLTEALMELYASVAVAVAVAVVALLIFRDDLRRRLRGTRPEGVPILSEAVVMISGYLTAEGMLGRIVLNADIDALARSIVGAVSLLFSDRDAAPVTTEAVHRLIGTVIAGVASK
jgi:AcrR family transcriptional regulator